MSGTGAYSLQLYVPGAGAAAAARSGSDVDKKRAASASSRQRVSVPGANQKPVVLAGSPHPASIPQSNLQPSSGVLQVATAAVPSAAFAEDAGSRSRVQPNASSTGAVLNMINKQSVAPSLAAAAAAYGVRPQSAPRWRLRPASETGAGSAQSGNQAPKLTATLSPWAGNAAEAFSFVQPALKQNGTDASGNRAAVNMSGASGSGSMSSQQNPQAPTRRPGVADASHTSLGSDPWTSQQSGASASAQQQIQYAQHQQAAQAAAARQQAGYFQRPASAAPAVSSSTSGPYASLAAAAAAARGAAQQVAAASAAAYRPVSAVPVMPAASALPSNQQTATRSGAAPPAVSASSAAVTSAASYSKQGILYSSAGGSGSASTGNTGMTGNGAVVALPRMAPAPTTSAVPDAASAGAVAMANAMKRPATAGQLLTQVPTGKVAAPQQLPAVLADGSAGAGMGSRRPGSADVGSAAPYGAATLISGRTGGYGNVEHMQHVDQQQHQLQLQHAHHHALTAAARGAALEPEGDDRADGDMYSHHRPDTRGQQPGGGYSLNMFPGSMLPSEANPPPADADEATKKAYQRQLQREREWLARQKLKQYVAMSEFDGRATTDFYGFGKVLGTGSFGEVRLAWHRLAGQKVAIKSYEKSKLTEPNHWRRVQQEIRLMERLNHPAIIRMLEMIDSAKRIHIVMEYAGGGNLCSYVKSKGRLGEPEARKIFLQLLAAVEYMHDSCIIHRDIKLENVLFDEEGGNLKLVDFGFSVMVRDPAKRLKIFCGTPSYMAPEITQRREYLGRPVDVWSLAVLLYACLCGHFPFTAKTYPDLYKKIAAAQVKFPDHLSTAVRDLLRRMLHPDPTKRLTLAHAKLHPWVAPSVAPVFASFTTPGDRSLLINDDPAADVNEAVLTRCEQLGFRRQKVLEAILSRTKNAYSTTYYLIISRVGRSAKVVPHSGASSSQQTAQTAAAAPAPAPAAAAPVRPIAIRPSSAAPSSSRTAAHAFVVAKTGAPALIVPSEPAASATNSASEDGELLQDALSSRPARPGTAGLHPLSQGRTVVAPGGDEGEDGEVQDGDDEVQQVHGGRARSAGTALRPRSAVPLGRHGGATAAHRVSLLDDAAGRSSPQGGRDTPPGMQRGGSPTQVLAQNSARDRPSSSSMLRPAQPTATHPSSGAAVSVAQQLAVVGAAKKPNTLPGSRPSSARPAADGSRPAAYDGTSGGYVTQPANPGSGTTVGVSFLDRVQAQARGAPSTGALSFMSAAATSRPAAASFPASAAGPVVVAPTRGSPPHPTPVIDTSAPAAPAALRRPTSAHVSSAAAAGPVRVQH